MNIITKLLIKELDSLKDRLKSDNCNLSEEEAMDILKIVAHESLSKDQACSFLNIRRSRFGELIREGKIPEGVKLRGFKELRWYKDKLIEAKLAMNKSPN